MEIKLTKDSLTRAGVIILLLSGLVFHDFFVLPGVKLGVITITYLRVALAVCLPLLVFFYKVRISKNDVLAYILIIFMLYGLFRIEGNLKEAFGLYCPLIAFFILYCTIDDERIIKKCVDVLSVFYIFFCLVGIYELITQHHLVETHFDYSDVTKHVACGMYYNENDFSAFLSVMMIYMLLSSFNRLVKLFFVLLGFIIICLNKSVVCILGLILFALIAFVIRKRTNFFFRLMLFLILVVILINPLTVIVNSSSIYWRKYMYAFGLKNVIEHMWFGVGIGNYADGMISVGYKPMEHTSADPHNLFFEIGACFGIVWAILFIFLLIKLLTWNLKRAANIQNLICFGLIILIPFIGFASSSCLEKNYIYIALLLPALCYRFNCKRNVVNRSFLVKLETGVT